MTTKNEATPSAAPSAAAQAEALKQLRQSGEALSWSAGFIALPWLKTKHRAKVDSDVNQWSISADGFLTASPKYLASCRPDERVFMLGHGMLRFLMRHHDRGVALGVVAPDGSCPPGQEREHRLWGKACAAVTNAPLRADAVGRAPADAVFPPDDYQGPMDAETLYYHLLKTEPPEPPGNNGSPPPGGSPPPQAGGHPQPPQGGDGESEGDQQDGEGQGEGRARAPAFSGDEIDTMRHDVETVARLAGRGTACVDALRPKVVRANYRSIIGAGLDVANTEASERTKNSYSRAARREPFDENILLPGKIGEDPSICGVIDVSGSTSHFAQKFIDHFQQLATEYPNVRIFLVTHTSDVCYAEWLKPGGDADALSKATAFSGGTDFEPAYAAARKVAPKGKFDALIHFTDGENGGSWPMPPARRLIVGLCGNTELPIPTPIPAKVVPVTEGA